MRQLLCCNLVDDPVVVMLDRCLVWFDGGVAAREGSG